MATNCYACGYRDNEVKSGGSVAAKGKKITLKVEDEEDLSRDLLKVSFAQHLAEVQADISLTPLVLRFLKSTLSCSPERLVDVSPPSRVCSTKSSTNFPPKSSERAMLSLPVLANKALNRVKKSGSLKTF
jgi:hypothetical protein